MLTVIITLRSALSFVLMKMCRSIAVEIIGALIIVAALLRHASVAIIRGVSTGFIVTKSMLVERRSHVIHLDFEVIRTHVVAEACVAVECWVLFVIR